MGGRHSESACYLPRPRSGKPGPQRPVDTPPVGTPFPAPQSSRAASSSAPWPGSASRPPKHSTTPISAESSHRDIKPSNLMLDEQGKLWISDFGLARFDANASLTATGDVLGNRPLHESGAGDGQAEPGRFPHRRLLAGHHALRTGHTARRVRRVGPPGIHALDQRGRAPAAAASRSGHPRRFGDDPLEGDRQVRPRTAISRRRSWPTTCGGSWKANRSWHGGPTSGTAPANGPGGIVRSRPRRPSRWPWFSSARWPARC